MSPRGQRILDFALLQAGWFVAVLGAAAGHGWAGPAWVLVALAVHLRITDDPRGELALAGAVLVTGIVVEGLLVGAGWVRHRDDVVALSIGPVGPVAVWILALWPLFATSFRSTLAWLDAPPWRAVVFGALGGPPGYFAAARLGALELPAGAAPTVGVLAALWAAALPLGLRLARRVGRAQRGTRT